jgi:hypothetical protein
MLSEWSVELGAHDPQLEIPWSSEDGMLRFLDLKRQPELLLEVREACIYPELAEFLSWANSPESPLETAKCDVWTSREISEEEQIFGETCKFGSYVDVLFASSGMKASFRDHEQFAQNLARLLRHAPEIASAAEFIVRHCIDHRIVSPAVSEGYYITFYLHGYGSDEDEARSRWAIALKLVQHAMMQQCSLRNPALHHPGENS